MGATWTSATAEGTARTIARKIAIPRMARAETLPSNERSPGILNRDCHRVRLQRRLVEHRRIPTEGLRRIDAHLRGEAISSARIDRGAADVMQHDESAIRLEPSCDGPFHIAVVEYVDVFVHDDDPLHRRVGPEGGHDRVLPVSLMLFADRDDPVEPGASSLRQTDCADVGDRAGDGLEDHGFS